MKKKIVPIFLLNVLLMIQTYFFLPLIPLYAKSSGLSAFLIGQIIFFYTLPQGIGKLIIGYLLDKIGCKKALILTNVIFGTGFIFYFFPDNFYLLASGQFVTGLARAFFMTSTSVYFTELDADARGKNMGIRTAGFGIGFFIGPLLGGIISDLWGMRILFTILFVSLTLNLYLLYILPDIRKKKDEEEIHVSTTEKIVKIIRNPSFIDVVLTGITMAGIITLIDNYLPIYLDELSLPIRLVGIILSLKGISQILFGPVVGRLSDVLGRYPFIYLGIIMGTTGILFLPLNQNYWPLILLVFITSMGFTILNPLSNAMASESVRPADRGLALGIWQSSVSFAMIIFSQIYSYIYSNYNIKFVFFITSVITGTTLLLILYNRSNTRDKRSNYTAGV